MPTTIEFFDNSEEIELGRAREWGRSKGLYPAKYKPKLITVSTPRGARKFWEFVEAKNANNS